MEKATGAQPSKAMNKPEDKKEPTVEEIAIQAAQGGKSDLVPVKGERGYYHVTLEKPYHDSTGKRLSKAQPQIFDDKSYDQFVKNNRQLGYTIVVSWNPIKYKEAIKAAKAEKAKE